MSHADLTVRKAYAQTYSKAHSEEAVARVKKWRKENPEKRKALARRYSVQHVDQRRQWYLENRQACIERARLNYEKRLLEDPEATRAKGRDRAARRRARLRSSAVEKVDPLVVWERDKGVCGICGSVADKKNWHLDHVVAIANGGEHSYANVRVSHPMCNWQKGHS